MPISRSCSWCHTMNVMTPGLAVFCSSCHHRGDVAMSQCDCLMCFESTARYLLPLPNEVEVLPLPADCLPVTEVIERRTEQDGTGVHSGDVQVAGRMLRAPIVVTEVTADFVRVRIDDVHDPEQWVEVIIFDEAVGRWWRQMCEANGHDEL